MKPVLADPLYLDDLISNSLLLNERLLPSLEEAKPRITSLITPPVGGRLPADDKPPVDDKPPADDKPSADDKPPVDNKPLVNLLINNNNLIPLINIKKIMLEYTIDKINLDYKFW